MAEQSFPRWSRRAYAAALAMAIFAIGLVATAAGSTAAEELGLRGFTMYASCSPNGVRHSTPTHVCEHGDQIRAVARYGAAPVDYTVCARFGDGPATCSSPQQTTPGRSSIVTLPSNDFVGRVTLSWRLGEEEIGSYVMRFVEDPIIPPYGVSTLIVSGTHRLFGLLIRHVPAGLRVRAWGECGHDCRLPLKLVSSKGENRRYRITASKAKSTFSFGDLLFVLVDAPGRKADGAELWGRLYMGKFVRDPTGTANDTAIHRVGILCSPPGLPFGFSKKCSRVRSPHAPLLPVPH